MTFTILTPSFNNLPYLPRCCASVADQAGVEVEHLVVDGASTDGTPAWLRARHQPFLSEPDHGMYDALNKGLDRARGAFVGWLNSDEQYLPGTLTAVADAFARHPGVDIVFGDALLVRPDGTLAAYRKAHPLRAAWLAASHLYALSCTLFFRRRILEAGFRFDATYRMVSDLDFVLRILRAGHRSLHLPRYLAAFTLTGKNLTLDPGMAAERARLNDRQPAWTRATRPLLNGARLLNKIRHGGYRQPSPLTYQLYVDPTQPRQTFTAEHPSFRWTWT
jgi:glycosyltransferase involved in cell wall biosynthesis